MQNRKANAAMPACCCSAGEECGDIRIRQRRVMLHFGDLRWPGEQLVQVTAPARRVLARAKAAGGGPVQHVLDPPTQALGGLRLRRPDWLQHLQHVRGLDRAYRQIADDREGVGRKRLPPLVAMLGIAPARRVRLDERFGAFGECHAAAL